VLRVAPNHCDILDSLIIKNNDLILWSETQPTQGGCPSRLFLLGDTPGCFSLSMNDLFIEVSDAL